MTNNFLCSQTKQQKFEEKKHDLRRQIMQETGTDGMIFCGRDRLGVQDLKWICDLIVTGKKLARKEHE